MLFRNISLSLACASLCFAQVTIPDGTKLRVRLDQPLSSSAVEEGQAVEFLVSETVKIDGVDVVKSGARATGTITEAVPKGRMGKAGKLDFSIDRVIAADGEWVPIRYTLQKKAGKSHSVRTGILTATMAIAFWPAAPVFLLMKGKDITINKGVPFEVFTDTTHVLAMAPAQSGPDPRTPRNVGPAAVHASLNSQSGNQQLGNSQPGGMSASSSGSAAITVTASSAGADIEVNGAFMGNTPTTLHLPAGTHQVMVRNGALTWGRTIQVTSGSTVSVHATLQPTASVTFR